MSLKNELEKIMETQDKGVEIIEETLLKCQKHICPHDLTRQECDIIYCNCEAQILCNRITHLIERNRTYKG